MAETVKLFEVDFSSISKSIQQLEQLKLAMDKLMEGKKRIKDLTVSEQAAYNDLNKQYKEVEKTVNLNIQLNRTNEGSINQLRRSLINANQAYDNLSKAQRENTSIGGKMLQNIKEIDAELKKLEADSGRFQRNVGNYPTVVDGLKEKFLSLTSVIAAAFSINAVKNFITESFKLAEFQDKVEKKLLTALDGRKGIQKELIKDAQKLQSTSIFSDEEIIQAQTYLAAQGRTEEQIKKTTQAAIRLSLVTGDDLDSAIKKLDATYEGNIGKMGKLDGSLKELSKEQLANGAAVDAINEKYSQFGNGVSSISGQLKQAGNLWDDFKEKIGTVLVELLKGSGILKVWTNGLSDMNAVLDDKTIPAMDRFFSIFNSGAVNALRAQQKTKDILNKQIEDIYETQGVQAAIEKINLASDQDTKLMLLRNLRDYRNKKKEEHDLEIENEKQKNALLAKERLDAAKKLAEKAREIELFNNSALIEERNKAELEARKMMVSEMENAEKEADKKWEDNKKNIIKKRAEINETALKQEIKQFEKAEEEKRKFAAETINKTQQLLSAGSDITSALYQGDLIDFQIQQDKKQQTLDQRLKSGLISEEQYNESSQALKNEAALKEKELKKEYSGINLDIQIAQIQASYAQGVMNAWASNSILGPLAIPAAIALTTLLTGVNIAQTALAMKQYEQIQALSGGGWVEGVGTTTSDSNLARLSKKEFVVNAASAAANAPELEQINKYGKILKSQQNNGIDTRQLVSIIDQVVQSKNIYVTNKNITETGKKANVLNNSLKI